jgi:glutathione synthase/RimK-type ligase-like ATP-grasp enzyme
LADPLPACAISGCNTAVGTDYAGVDLFLSPTAGPTIIEVNGIPGWHGIEMATGVDIATALAAHVEALVASV